MTATFKIKGPDGKIAIIKGTPRYQKHGSLDDNELLEAERQAKVAMGSLEILEFVHDEIAELNSWVNTRGHKRQEQEAIWQCQGHKASEI